jgi:hypothetical protein
MTLIRLGVDEDAREPDELDEDAACGCGPIPGVLWPINYDGLPGEKRAVQRCDECGTYESDTDAGFALLQHLTSTTGQPHTMSLDPDGSGSYDVYVDPVTALDINAEFICACGSIHVLKVGPGQSDCQGCGCGLIHYVSRIPGGVRVQSGGRLEKPGESLGFCTRCQRDNVYQRRGELPPR